MPLSQRQEKDLNTAILEYLSDHGYTETLESFKKETSLEPPNMSLKSLERKWTAVVRLTKKNQDLEKQIDEITKELKEAKPFAYMQDPKSKQHKLFDDILPNNTLFTLKRHQKCVNRVLFHPTYSWMVSCGDGAMIGVWDFETGKLEKWIRGHTNAIHDISFNNNGTLLASCSSDMSVRIWNFEDEFRCIKTLNGHDHAVTGVAFNPNNNDILLSCSRDGTIKFWDMQTGFSTNTIQDAHDGEWVKRVIISFDGSIYATCSVDQTARVFDMKSNEEIHCLRGHSHVVECIAFSHPSSEAVISGKQAILANNEMKSDDTDVETNNINNSNNKRNNNGKAIKFEIGPPQYLVSGGRDKNIIIWSLKSGMAMITLKGHENWVRGVLFHPCGRFLISCADDRSIRVWDLAHQREREANSIPNAHQGFVSCIAWHAGQNLLASASPNKIVKIWNYDPKKY